MHTLAQLALIVIFCDRMTSLIIPEEVPSLLSLIYSNIPPIKKGTDSRIGVGFRLGEHADFQVVLELGPQTETEPLDGNNAKRRRDAMMGAAMRGELGPLAQAVAKYQMERRIRKEEEKLKAVREKLKKLESDSGKEEKTVANEWLTAWSKDMTAGTENQVPLKRVSLEKFLSDEKIGGIIEESKLQTSGSGNIDGEKIKQLSKLYKPVGDNKES